MSAALISSYRHRLWKYFYNKNFQIYGIYFINGDGKVGKKFSPGETFQLKINNNFMVVVVVMSGEKDQNH